MPIRCTITAANVVNEYGQTLAIGTVYTPFNDDYALALIQQGKAQDTDASLVDPGVGEGMPNNIVFVNAAAIASPTAAMLRDYGTEYALDVAPFTRYRTNGTNMIVVPTLVNTVGFQSVVDGSGNLITGPTLRGVQTWDLFNVYDLGYVKNPTIFYDPSASGSAGLGTFRNPYTTLAQVNSRCKGNMAGQVLGIQRGTTSRGSVVDTGVTAVLNLYGVYGTSAAPFYICPYGNAEAMPIFSGGAVRQSWAFQSGGVWKHAVGATGVDVFQSQTRLKAVAAGASEALTIAAVQAAGAGFFSYFSSAVYVFPLSGENPNLGQMETNDIANACSILYTDIASTGHIIVAGIDFRMSNSNGLRVAQVTTTNAPSNIQLVGNRVGNCGTDFVNQGNDAILVYGASDSQRLTNGYIAGNYLYSTINNAVEIGAWSGGSVEKNMAVDIGGNCINELWYSCSSVKTRWNRGYGDLYAGSRLLTGYKKGGFWIAGFTTEAGGSPDASKSTGNVCAFNYMQDCTIRGVDLEECQNTAVYCNSIVNANIVFGGSFLSMRGGASATGNAFNSNLCYDSVTTTHFARWFDHSNAAGGAITGNKNSYTLTTNPSNASWRFAGTNYTTLATWRTASSMDAASVLTATNLTYGIAPTLTASGTSYTLASSNLSGLGVSVTSTGETFDVDGRIIAAPATPAVGAIQQYFHPLPVRTE
jgi:hypothetical protein